MHLSITRTHSHTSSIPADQSLFLARVVGSDSCQGRGCQRGLEEEAGRDASSSRGASRLSCSQYAPRTEERRACHAIILEPRSVECSRTSQEASCCMPYLPTYLPIPPSPSIPSSLSFGLFSLQTNLDSIDAECCSTIVVG